MPETLFIRADADDRIGVGHVMRCIALFQAWQDAGGVACLAAVSLPDTLRRRCVKEGLRVVDIGPGRDELGRAVRDSVAAWVVLDGYAFAIEDQTVVKDEDRRLLVIDDDGSIGRYVADVLVDPNVFADERAYPPSTCARLLLGSRYALLRRELAGVVNPTRSGDGARVLVTFGGADPAELSQMAVAGLGVADLDVTVVVGPANPRVRDIEAAAEAFPRVRVVCDVPDMRQLMEGTDVAVVAAGGTCLELAHFGVPQLVVVTAPNQTRVARTLADRGVARTLGEAGRLTSVVLREEVLSLLGDAVTRREMRRAGMELVDGGGARRVVETMMEMVT